MPDPLPFIRYSCEIWDYVFADDRFENGFGNISVVLILLIAVDILVGTIFDYVPADEGRLLFFEPEGVPLQNDFDLFHFDELFAVLLTFKV